MVFDFDEYQKKQCEEMQLKMKKELSQKVEYKFETIGISPTWDFSMMDLYNCEDNCKWVVSTPAFKIQYLKKIGLINNQISYEDACLIASKHSVIISSIKLKKSFNQFPFNVAITSDLLQEREVTSCGKRVNVELDKCFGECRYEYEECYRHQSQKTEKTIEFMSNIKPEDFDEITSIDHIAGVVNYKIGSNLESIINNVLREIPELRKDLTVIQNRGICMFTISSFEKVKGRLLDRKRQVVSDGFVIEVSRADGLQWNDTKCLENMPGVKDSEGNVDSELKFKYANMVYSCGLKYDIHYKLVPQK